MIRCVDSHGNDYKTHVSRRALEMIGNFYTPLYQVQILEPTGTIGSTVPVRVQVKTCALSQSSLILKEHEDTSVHSWQWVNFPSGNVESSTTVDGVTTSVYRWDWNTIPLHNGSHLLHADLNVTAGGIQKSVSDERSVTVRNLLVSASPAYLVSSSGMNANHRIDYGLDDAVSDSNTQVTISIYSSSQALIRSETFTQSTGLGKSYVWDGKDSAGTVMPSGIYLYKVSAVQGDGDSDCDKSNWSITSTSVPVVNGDMMTGTMTIRAGAHIAPEMGCTATTVSSASVDAFDTDLLRVGGTTNITTTLFGNIICIQYEQDERDGYRGVRKSHRQF